MVDDIHVSKKARREVIEINSDSDTTDGESSPAARARRKEVKRLPSPIKLNSIPLLPLSENVDCLRLQDLLTEEVLETWQINYSIDVAFLLQSLPHRTRDSCQVNIITEGYDVRAQLQTLLNPSNVKLHSITVEDRFGTHQ